MLVALYTGPHVSDALHVRLAWYLTRLMQKGSLGVVTHVEAIHAQHDDGTVTIASASLRDGGVRTKRTKLNPAHWTIVDVPQWSVLRSIAWFEDHDGEQYDWRGALATVLPGANVWDRWFCNEALGASVGLVNPQTFGPHQFAAVCLSIGRDVTATPLTPSTS